MLWMGIDGGGSNLRVVITNNHLETQTIVYNDACNPSLLGQTLAKERIQQTIRKALLQVHDRIAGVGIGIAGAPNFIAEAWLRNLVHEIVPYAHIVPSSDNEIGLVGALGKRHGLMLLAGTGSGSFGMNTQGEALQIGGWGYLLGDEGSGYWFGVQALKHMTCSIDRGEPLSNLGQNIADAHHLSSMSAIIEWVYHRQASPVPTIAKLAPLVLQAAQENDPDARHILNQAVDYFANLTETLKQRLSMPEPDIAFAGSLLTKDTLLRRQLIPHLNLSVPPSSLYEPVIGAALLAKLDYESQTTPTM